MPFGSLRNASSTRDKLSHRTLRSCSQVIVFIGGTSKLTSNVPGCATCWSCSSEPRCKIAARTSRTGNRHPEVGCTKYATRVEQSFRRTNATSGVFVRSAYRRRSCWRSRWRRPSSTAKLSLSLWKQHQHVQPGLRQVRIRVR